MSRYDNWKLACAELGDDNNDIDYLYDLLLYNKVNITPSKVYMGLNTTKGYPEWEDSKSKIREHIKKDGICLASWSCTGRTKHMTLSSELKKDMPEYKFNIGENYYCEIRER